MPVEGTNMSPELPRQAPAPDVLLWTAKQAAEALSISQRKLWELTNCREIPCVRIGKCVRYSPDDLRAWIDSRKGKRH